MGGRRHRRTEIEPENQEAAGWEIDQKVPRTVKSLLGEAIRGLGAAQLRERAGVMRVTERCNGSTRQRERSGDGERARSRNRERRRERQRVTNK